MSDSMNELEKCLEDLNQWLAEHELTIQIAIIGRYAFYLSGFHQVATLDIDSVTEIEERVYEKILEIGKRRGMKPDWLNDNAETLPLPDGFKDRLIETKQFSNINMKYAARIDLISLKAAAYISRGEDDPKDFQDLLLLAPTNTEIESSINYIRKHFSPPADRFNEDFEERLNELRTHLKK